MKHSLAGAGFAAMIAETGGDLRMIGMDFGRPAYNAKPRPPTKEELERKAKRKAQKHARKQQRKR